MTLEGQERQRLPDGRDGNRLFQNLVVETSRVASVKLPNFHLIILTTTSHRFASRLLTAMMVTRCSS